MRMRWMLWAFAAAAAVGGGTALVDRVAREPAPGYETAFGRDDAARGVGGAAPDRVAPERFRATTAVSPVPNGASAVGSSGAVAGKPDARIEEELRRTEEALASSRRVSEPRDVAPAPPEESLAAAGPGAAARSLCRGAGLACGSSAECCPGLSCAGGVAGYGTKGRCEGQLTR